MTTRLNYHKLHDGRRLSPGKLNFVVGSIYFLLNARPVCDLKNEHGGSHFAISFWNGLRVCRLGICVSWYSVIDNESFTIIICCSKIPIPLIT